MEELLRIVDVYTMPYGKYKGETIGDISRSDNSYLVWLADNSKDTIFRYVLNKYLDSEIQY